MPEDEWEDVESDEWEDLPTPQKIPEKHGIMGGIKSVALAAIRPIRPLAEGVEILSEKVAHPFAEAERAILPGPLTDQAPTIPLEAARAAFRSTIPFPSPALAKAAVQLTVPQSPLDIAATAISPVVGLAKTILPKAPVAKAPATTVAKDLGEVYDELVEAIGKAPATTRSKIPAEPQIFPRAETAAGAMENPGPYLAQAFEGTKQVAQTYINKLRALGVEKVLSSKTPGRIIDVLVDAISKGDITPADGARYFGLEYKASETPELFAQRLADAGSSSGKLMNQLSQVRKALNESADPALKKLGEAMESAVSKKTAEGLEWWEYALKPVEGVGAKTIQTWRSLLVTQIGTAVRNFRSQGIMLGADTFQQAINGSLRALTGKEAPRAAFSNAIENIMSIGRYMDKAKINQTIGILDNPIFATQRAMISSSRMGDLGKLDGLIGTLNYFNRKAEDFARFTAFDARIRSDLTRLGIGTEDLSTLIKVNPKASKALVDDAVEHALEMSFAAYPKTALPKAILETYRVAPVLHLIGPTYPRFWFNAMRTIMEYSPAGIMFTRLGSKNPELVFQGLSKALVGTSMYAAAYAVRASKIAGEKWYEIRPQPDSKPGRVVDNRADNPWASMLFVADLTKRMIEVKSGKRETLGYSAQDLTNAVFALRRTDLSGLPFLDNLVFNKEPLGADPQSWVAPLTRTIGSFLAGFATPLQSPTDLITSLRGQEQEIRSSRESPLLGPIAAKLPKIRGILPEAPAVTRPAPLRREFPGLRLAGIAQKEKTPVEAELDRLDISRYDFLPKSTDKESDRLISERMGTVAGAFLAAMVKSQGYRAMSDSEKKDALVSLLSKIRAQAREEVYEEKPLIGLAARARGVRSTTPGKSQFLEAIEKRRRELQGFRLP